MTKRLCGHSCEPENVRRSSKDSVLYKQYWQQEHNTQQNNNNSNDGGSAGSSGGGRFLVKEESALNELHLEQAKRNLAKFDVVMFLNDFAGGLARLAKVHPEWARRRSTRAAPRGVAPRGSLHAGRSTRGRSTWGLLHAGRYIGGVADPFLY